MVTALAAGATVTHAADAQSITAGGGVSARFGYSDNPYLGVGSAGATAVAGGSVNAWLQHRSEKSTTRLAGIADLDQNFQNYGLAENYLVTLDHQQTFSARLSGSAQLRFQDSINPRNFSSDDTTGVDTPNVDLLSIGQRSRTIGGSGTLQWAPTSRDSFYIGPQYSRTTYPSSNASDFETYGLRGGYMRSVNAKMKVGLDLAVQRVKSDGFGTSTSYQGGVRLIYDFSPIWQFDGNVGLIHQTSSFGGSSNTPGFSARVCGKYPRYRVCFEGSRQSAASGFGGLRTDNRVSTSLDYDLSTRSHLRFGAVYDVSQSRGFSSIPTQKYYEVSSGYSRTLTDRLSAGFSGRYQYRDFGNIVGVDDSTVTGYAVTFDIGYKFGRLD